MNTAQFRKPPAVAILCFLLALSGVASAASDTNSSPAELAAKVAEYTASNEVLRAYIQFQAEIRDAQFALERARHEVAEASVQNAFALSNRLQSIEQSLAAQREHEANTIEAMQSTGRFMLTALSVFAGVGFIAIALTAFFQWRTISRLAEIAAAVPATRPISPLSSIAALGFGEGQFAASSEVSSAKLLDTIGRLEQRLTEIEHATHPALEDRQPEKNGENSGSSGNGENAATANAASIAASPADSPASGPVTGNKSLLNKGQALLNEDKAEEAIACFDEALSQNPNDTDALVKKGAALEKLRKLQEAIECYDRAIALDDTLTIAYLHKGGLYNRMERFSEAVDCYEQALRTQEKRRAA